MISTLRKISQFLFFFFFVSSFFLFPEVFGIYFLSLPYSILFKFSLFFILFLILALITGRAFCGWVCPLGAIFDLLPSFGKAKDWNLKEIKFYIFIFLMLTSLLFLLDPFSIFTRITLIYRFIPLSIFSIIIIIVNFASKRWFCKFLCPAGGLLGIFNKVSLLNREIKETCNSCMLCEYKCPMLKDVYKNSRDVNCIFCGDCVKVCPVNAISFKFSLPEGKDFNPERREFLKLGGIITAGILFSTFTEMEYMKSIFPPGVLNYQRYSKKCLRCGLCVEKCPTSIIKLNGIEPPYIEFSKEKYCIETCNICGNVCPTDAIPDFSIKEKKKLKMGKAVINRDTCYTWRKEKFCNICYVKCPYEAIELKESFEVYVLNNKCTGCGACEAYCPNGSIIIHPL